MSLLYGWLAYDSALTWLLGRLLRCLASLGTIKEVEMDKFTSTNITQSLATLGVQAGLYHQ